MASSIKINPSNLVNNNPLVYCSTSVPFFFRTNLIFASLGIICCRFGLLELFGSFFIHALRFRFETWHINSAGGAAVRVQNFLVIDTLAPTLQPKLSQNHFLHS